MRSSAGQTTTADGVAALARGDYQLAVEILKPIAEDRRSNDPAAQFFMAGLYDSGRGVPRTRCAPARSTSARGASPIVRSAASVSAVCRIDFARP